MWFINQLSVYIVVRREERLGHPYSVDIPYSMGSRLELLRVSQPLNSFSLGLEHHNHPTTREDLGAEGERQ